MNIWIWSTEDTSESHWSWETPALLAKQSGKNGVFLLAKQWWAWHGHVRLSERRDLFRICRSDEVPKTQRGWVGFQYEEQRTLDKKNGGLGWKIIWRTSTMDSWLDDCWWKTRHSKDTKVTLRLTRTPICAGTVGAWCRYEKQLGLF